MSPERPTARGQGSAAGDSRPPRPRVPRGAVTAGDGLLLVDKPAGITSHDVVGAVRRLAATRKVGHAGTLDPMATGLLVVGIGRATRLLTHLVGADKAYRATIRLGQETSTEDAEGRITASSGCTARQVDAPRITRALACLTGTVMQVPSAVSAIKVDGVRSYARVRDGEQVELEARQVVISALDLIGEPRAASAQDGTPVVDIDVEVACSSGTYVRAIARDLGRGLGCGAHLIALRRSAVGPLEVGWAATLEALSAQVQDDAAASQPRGLAVMPMAQAARLCFESVELSQAQAQALRHGQFLDEQILDSRRSPVRPIASATSGGVVAGFAPSGSVVALLVRKGHKARPVLVLDPA
ncbi:tRNA pseudouridine(55) synthase TruB [Actinomyces slackii]|uniref:tRNA pseudouridine synthase B n=1 Tax=Actinomyces slackii TaxID=52774 RepID=A0A3S4SLI3_9ACTO|nr:tRNA pseudouridine synthase B [Actinomyces slackii]